MTEYTYYRAPDGTAYRVSIVPDPDAESPRIHDGNLATLLTYDHGSHSPDPGLGGTPFPREYLDRFSFGTVNLRYLRRYAALFRPNVLAVTGLARTHDGTLAVTDADEAIGVAFVTRESWQTHMGPTEPSAAVAMQAIKQEVADYNLWASSQYVGFVVEEQTRWVKVGLDGSVSEPTMTTWLHVESLWGIDDRECARDEALKVLPEGSVEITEGGVGR